MSRRRALTGLVLSVVAAVSTLAACSSDDDRLVLYSGRTSNLIGPLLEDFADESGISIDVRYGDSADLALLIDEEGDRTPADVFISQSPGAVGFLDAGGRLAELSDELIAAVRRIGVGDSVFTPGLAGLVLGEFRRMALDPGPEMPPGEQLTDRETEVLKMVAKGMSYKQIAERLVLSHRTVQNHVQNTLRKLQLHNRVELTRYAIEQGLDE